MKVTGKIMVIYENIRRPTVNVGKFVLYVESPDLLLLDNYT